MKKPNSPKTEKYVTMSVFEKAMASIARSFSSLDQKLEKRFDRIEQKMADHDKAFNFLIKMYQGHNHQMKEQESRMSSLESNDIKQERAIDVLNARAGIVTIK